MTLEEFFRLLAEHPLWLVGYFGALPLLAWATADLSRGKGHLDPWRYVYSVLIYLSAVPGIFSLTLSLWVFLFERRSIFQMDVLPGFDRLSGLVMMIVALLVFFWILDKTRIIVFSYMPFGYAILIFAGLLVVAHFGWKRFAG